MAEPQAEQELVAERGLFRAEYERELGTWLRRRLGYLCIAYAVFHAISVTALVLSSQFGPDASARDATDVADVARDPAADGADGADGTRPAADSDALPSEDAGMDRPTPADAKVEDVRDAARDRAAPEDATVATTLETIGTIARDVATEIGPIRIRPAQQRSADRWWEEEKAAAPADSATKTAPDAEGAGAEGATGGVAADSQDDAAAGTAPEPTQDERRRPARKALEGLKQLEAASEWTLQLPWWLWVVITLPNFGVLAWFGLVVRPKLDTRSELVAAASRMILSLGLLNFGFECALLLAHPGAGITPLLSIFYWHLTASLFLPWNWRESLKPILPLLACWFLFRLGLATSDGSWSWFVGSLVGAPFLFAPALILCYARLRWHQRRFKSGFVGRRFIEMRREFIQARAVHESLFPKPEDLGWLRFDFGYRPAADIGGDFIHSWTDDSDRFHVALIDVTGHGLASAMTVARIHGEIERLRDEHPDEGPARMLARLNRYFQRLLSRYRLFATAVLITVDPRTGELRYASAGHPPVFLRSRNGVRELESTTFLLGAVDNSVFGEEEVSIQLEEGDRLILYTDGAYDAKNPRGERFGLDRLREIIRRPAPPPKWTQFLMNLIETFEAGMPEDDLLVAEVVFLSRKSVSSSVTGDDLPVPRSGLAGARA